MSNTGKKVIIPLVSGNKEVTRLTPRHMIALGDKIYDEQRKQLIKDLEDAGCTSAEKRDSLTNIRRGVASSLLDYVWTMRGALDVISIAVDKDVEELSDDLNSTLDDIVGMAVDLLGYKIDFDENGDNKKK
jgi:hypothetical protein